MRGSEFFGTSWALLHSFCMGLYTKKYTEYGNFYLKIMLLNQEYLIKNLHKFNKKYMSTEK